MPQPIPSDARTPMATSAPCLETAILRQLRDEVSNTPVIDSVCIARGESMFYVWVGIREDTLDAWKAVGEVEDRMSVRNPGILFDFHIIPIPPDRRLEDFVSATQRVYRRAA